MADAAPSATPFIERLEQSADEQKRLAIANEVLCVLETADAAFRYQLALLIEDRKLYRWAPWFAPHVIERAESPSEEALWRALDAWASFVTLDYAHCQEEALKVVNMELGTSAVDLGARTRALTMLAYTRDVAGDHAAASAWYGQALTTALPHQRAGLLLDLATSLSKQGRWDESLASFDNSIASLPQAGEPRATRLRAQNLSRRAVVLEMMGNAEKAVALQREAIGLARSINDREGAFSASLRLVRHLIALRRFDEALGALSDVADLEATERNGRLYVAHDRARVLRARGSWADARSAYAAAMNELPEGPDEIVLGNLDIWLEVTSGLADVCRELGDVEIEQLATTAHTTASRLAAARGIYQGAPTERARLAERAADTAGKLRSKVRAPGRVETPAFIIDFSRGTLTRRATSKSYAMREIDIMVLQALDARGGDGWVRSLDLNNLIRSGNRAPNIKEVVYEMRIRYELETEELVLGQGGPGSKYRLVRE